MFLVPNGMLGRIQTRMAGLLIAVLACCVLVASPLASATGQAGRRYYATSKRAALKVELTIYRHHVYRASVSANGICSNGEPSREFGLGIVGGVGLPIRGPKHRFGRTVIGTTHSLVFRGRVEGDKVVGVFRQMFRLEPPQEGGKEEVPKPQCGTGSSPKGEVLHFRAKRVSAKQMPPSMR